MHKHVGNMHYVFCLDNLINYHGHHWKIFRRFFVESENRWVSLRVSNAGLRVIDKLGIDAVLADLRARGEKV